jgi:hypothetical protein
MRFSAFALLLLAALPARGADAGYVNLFNRRNLDGWEVIGDGLWNVTSDGLLVGQRDPHNAHAQSWLYTRRDFDEFDLRAVYWLRFGGNSGISIRDTSRAKFAVPPDWNAVKTPSHIGYEIQLQNNAGDPYPTGSVYLFDKAREGVLKDNDWNEIEIQVRHSAIKVFVNGQLVSQSPGDPARSLTGPIGIQLHDASTLILVKSIEIREIGAGK